MAKRKKKGGSISTKYPASDLNGIKRRKFSDKNKNRGRGIGPAWTWKKENKSPGPGYYVKKNNLGFSTWTKGGKLKKKKKKYTPHLDGWKYNS